MLPAQSPLSNQSSDGLIAETLLDNEQCRELVPQINECYNAVFGPEFSCTFETIRPWTESGNLFFSVISGGGMAGRQPIRSVASLLLTTRASRERLFAGQIQDVDLTPYALAPRGSEPDIYFVSIISAKPQHVRTLYAGLCADVETYLEQHRISVPAAFSIAASAAGERHMTRNGFSVWNGGRYQDKYPIMRLDHATARTDIWQTLLRPRQTLERPAMLPSAA